MLQVEQTCLQTLTALTALKMLRNDEEKKRPDMQCKQVLLDSAPSTDGRCPGCFFLTR